MARVDIKEQLAIIAVKLDDIKQDIKIGRAHV